MDFFSFTPQETKAIIFLVVVLLVGSGVTLYKKYHPDFAPELLLKEDLSRKNKAFEPVRSAVTLDKKDLNKVDGKINLNSASLKELESLPGIGPELGKRILDYREKKGRFSTADELKEVRGIGHKTFEKLKNLICVE